VTTFSNRVYEGTQVLGPAPDDPKLNQCFPSGWTQGSTNYFHLDGVRLGMMLRPALRSTHFPLALRPLSLVVQGSHYDSLPLASADLVKVLFMQYSINSSGTLYVHLHRIRRLGRCQCLFGSGAMTKHPSHSFGRSPRWKHIGYLN